LPCEALGDGAIVNCGPPTPGDAVSATNPVVVVEVLSSSTESIDLSDKLAYYFKVDTIQHCLIIRSRRREGFITSAPGIKRRVINVGSIKMDPPGITIDLKEIYP
jgi:Uma2 family endonuclease